MEKTTIINKTRIAKLLMLMLTSILIMTSSSCSILGAVLDDPLFESQPAEDTSASEIDMTQDEEDEEGTSPTGTKDLSDVELLYKRVPVMQFLGAGISDVLDALGEPDSIKKDMSGGMTYTYDGLFIFFDANFMIGYFSMDPEVCEIDRVSLDKNREELVAMLGPPKNESIDEHDGSITIEFVIRGCVVRFYLEAPDEKAYWMEFFRDA